MSFRRRRRHRNPDTEIPVRYLVNGRPGSQSGDVQDQPDSDMEDAEAPVFGMDLSRGDEEV